MLCRPGLGGRCWRLAAASLSFAAAGPVLGQSCQPGWSALASGLTHSGFTFVRALAAFDDDGPGPHSTALIAGGQFSSASGTPVTHLAKWDGSAWAALPALAINPVNALGVFDDDGAGPHPPGLYVGSGLGGAAIYKLESGAWSAVGGGVSAACSACWYVSAITVHDADGPGPGAPALYIGGFFDLAGSVPVRNVAKWDGSAWSAVGTTITNPVAGLISWDPDGAGPALPLLVAGVLSGSVSAWNGSTWAVLGPAAPVANAKTFAIYQDLGTSAPALYAAGPGLTVGGGAIRNIARWDGTAWAVPGGGVGPSSYAPTVDALAVFDIDGPAPKPAWLYLAGAFQLAGSLAVNNMAAWDGTTWHPVDSGLFGGLRPRGEALLVCDQPNLAGMYVAGEFTAAGLVPANNIARWACAPPPACYANCDGSTHPTTGRPTLDVNDFNCFQNRFAAQDPYADCDGNYVFDIYDFSCFQNRFAIGCP